jgi:putative PIN family toxin of toxin-antitoxin system
VRIVLDTNVFISGVFFGGPPFEILAAWRRRQLRLVGSPEILDEYRRVGEILADRYSGVDLAPILDLVVLYAEIFDARPLAEAVCADPDDDKFIACARAANVTHIISGDRHLRNASGYCGIEVLSPPARVSQSASQRVE